eukprot:jgi/Botrbrau1/20558/Bobra.145_2s0105.1
MTCSHYRDGHESCHTTHCSHACSEMTLHLQSSIAPSPSSVPHVVYHSKALLHAKATHSLISAHAPVTTPGSHPTVLPLCGTLYILL